MFYNTWFIKISLDISTNAKTKEEYLSKGCQARIRGYLSKARTQLFAAKFDNTVLDKQLSNIPLDCESIGKCNKTPTRFRRKSINPQKKSDQHSIESSENEDHNILHDEEWDEIDSKAIMEYRGIEWRRSYIFSIILIVLSFYIYIYIYKQFRILLYVYF